MIAKSIFLILLSISASSFEPLAVGEGGGVEPLAVGEGGGVEPLV